MGTNPIGSRAIFRFDEFELDPVLGQLRRGGEPVVVGEQALALLEQLVRRAGEDVSHEQIHAQVWPGVTVNDGSLRHAIWELRQALGDIPSAPRFVRTLRGRGYRFVAMVRVSDRDAALVAELPPPRKEFVGRGDELSRLLTALDDTCTHAGRVCVLRGAPGIGKSRLAREFVQAASARGVACLEGIAERDVERPPFWPWIQLLGRVLGELGREQRARYLTDAPSVAGMFAHGAERAWLHVPFTDAPDQQRLYLFEELTRLIAQIAREHPLLLLLEDIQWLDEASMAFLRYFAGMLPPTHMLLVATCRDLTRREHRPLALTLDTIGRGPLNLVVELAPLTLEHIAELLRAHGMSAATPELVAQVHALTLGNPLFALEMARLLGRREAGGEAPRLDEAHREVRGVIKQRLDTLPDRCREAALAASVWGDQCGIAELAALLEESPDDALERVDECVRRGILTERAPLRFGFSHPLVEEVAYASLSRTERTQLHRRAGEWLERKVDSQVTHINALAHHFFCAASAAVAQRAVDYAAQCAERAFAATAYEAAIKNVDQALAAAELLPGFSPGARLALELSRAEAQRAAGADVQQVDRVFHSLSERAKLLGDPRLIARAALGYNSNQRMVGSRLTSFALISDPRGIALLEDALARVDPSDLELRARLLSALAFALVYGPERARRASLNDAAIALARAHGSPALIAHTLMFAQWTNDGPHDYATQRRVVDALIAHAQKHALREVEFNACLQRSVLAIGSLDLDQSERDVARAGVLAELIGSERARANSQTHALFDAFWRGDVVEAERLIEVIFQAQPVNVQHQGVYIVRKQALLVLRDGVAYLPQLIVQIKGVLAMLPNGVTPRCSLASAYAALGQLDAARAEFDEIVRDGFDALPQEAAWLGDMIVLADVAVRLGCRERARAVYARLLPFADRFAFVYFDALPAGPVARALAELAVMTGSFDAAARHLAVARDVNQRLGAHMFLEYDALAEARLLSMSRPPGWATRVTELLSGVSKFAERRGARWLADYASASYEHFLGGAQVVRLVRDPGARRS